MNPITTNTATEINRYHELATQRAGEAIEHAKTAGRLLLEVKATMPRGKWLTWLAANIHVTPRRCQQYMAIAQGRAIPASLMAEQSNAKSISHKEVDAPRLFCGGPDIAPTFLPDPEACLVHIAEDKTLYLIEPSSNHAGFFFVSRINNDDSESYDCTRRPIAAEWVEHQLQTLGLESPISVAWKGKPTAGVLTAMETFDEVAA